MGANRFENGTFERWSRLEILREIQNGRALVTLIRAAEATIPVRKLPRRRGLSYHSAPAATPTR